MRNERLRDALAAAGVSTDALAEELAVDPKTVERWITKGRIPYRKHRSRIAARLHTTETYLWPDALSSEEAATVSQSELVTFFPHRNSIPTELWDRVLSDATERIDLVMHAALFLVERPNFVKALAAKSRNGCSIRLAFGDPASREVTRRSEEERLGKHTLAARIRNALAFYRPLFEMAEPEIRFHRTTLYNSIFRFDDEMIVNTHVFGIQGAHAPAMHLRRLSSGSLFDTYAQSFEEVWRTSKPATLEEANLDAD
jgi:transcriptional regulator with XRE-family HTH domain